MKQPAALRTGPPARRAGNWREHVAFNANPLLAVKLPAGRSKLLLFLLFCGFLALAGRAVVLQGSKRLGQRPAQQGEARYARTLEVPATRGKVADRNGVVLAASVPAKAIWAIPDDVDASPQQIADLAQLLQMSVVDLKRLLDEDRSFVYLRRQVGLDRARAIDNCRSPISRGIGASILGAATLRIWWASPTLTITARRVSSSRSAPS